MREPIVNRGYIYDRRHWFFERDSKLPRGSFPRNAPLVERLARAFLLVVLVAVLMVAFA